MDANPRASSHATLTSTAYVMNNNPSSSARSNGRSRRSSTFIAFTETTHSSYFSLIKRSICGMVKSYTASKSTDSGSCGSAPSACALRNSPKSFSRRCSNVLAQCTAPNVRGKLDSIGGFIRFASNCRLTHCKSSANIEYARAAQDSTARTTPSRRAIFVNNKRRSDTRACNVSARSHASPNMAHIFISNFFTRDLNAAKSSCHRIEDTSKISYSILVKSFIATSRKTRRMTSSRSSSL